ncbi:hypothetical protein KIN20_027614 [Parelaphostrongylus tenuis]|uniref:SCP domain-containing protein n=1 Tax=Parelaphostrongylus tenuis TaxID=148309 RepID=A0AAD5QZU1_PARTN|nr:hypothetical protein KIN20_027614 [Parelaphostrongylus tenuis]
MSGQSCRDNAMCSGHRSWYLRKRIVRPFYVYKYNTDTNNYNHYHNNVYNNNDNQKKKSLVARGLARNGEYRNENAPPASRMDLMEYDCHAEQLALNHARSCDRRLSSPFARPGYSENIHVLGTTATDLLGAIQNAIATFTGELSANGIPSNMILTPQVLQRTHRTVTRVAKVLWNSNRFVGCATVLCSGFYFTSCMYREP